MSSLNDNKVHVCGCAICIRSAEKMMIEIEERTKSIMGLDALTFKDFRHHHIFVRRWIKGVTLEYNSGVVVG